MARTLAVVALVLSLTAPLGAQARGGPTKGTWGAETSFQPEATLLKFRSASRAWFVGITAHYLHETLETAGTSVDFRTRSDRIQLDSRFGARFYRDTASALRPFMSIGAVGGFIGGDISGWTAGGAMDAGAAYFFSPHVSLAASGEFGVLTRRFRQSSVGVRTEQSFTSAGFNGFRVLGAVYF
ncbi:MAG TPA: hypothetical protein VFT29_18735 [Gemmatimonadaceae bacterium]|nr:hypothetical protein [Gemmatimonadaceae bacterium]